MKSAKGITLIALVITIIVLIILAGVVINLSIGENGIFRKANESTELYEESSAKEKLEIELDNLLIDKETENEYDDEVFNQYLTQKGFIVNGDIVIYNGYQFKVDKSVPKILQNLGKKVESKNIKIEKVYNYEESNYKSCLVTIKIEYKGTINTINIAGENQNIPEAENGVYTITKSIEENGIYSIYITNAEDEYIMDTINIEDIIVYKIKYISNGAEGTVALQRKAMGENIIISESTNLKKSDTEIFKHWNTKADGSGTIYLPGDSYGEDEDLVLYAIWMEGVRFAGYEQEFTNLTWDITNSKNFVLSSNCLTPITREAGSTSYAYCKSELLDVKNYNFLRIKITRLDITDRGNSGLYVGVGSSQKTTDILNWHNLATYATVAGKTLNIDIPIETTEDIAYISFKMPVTSGNSYAWEITEISIHN